MSWLSHKFSPLLQKRYMYMEVRWYRENLSCYWRFKINKSLPLKERQHQRQPQMPKTKKAFSVWHKWVKPGKKSLLLSSSWMRWTKGLSAWIVSSFWSHSSPNFWTGQSRFILSNWFFFSSVSNCLLLKPTILTEPAKATAWLLGQGQNCILARCETTEQAQQRSYSIHA